MKSETNLPQRIPHTLYLLPIDPIEPPSAELLERLATALDQWDTERGTRTDPTGPGATSMIPNQTAGQTLAG